MGQRLVGFTQQLSHQIPKCLNKGRKRNVVVELVKFTFDKIAPLPHDGLMDFIDDSRFANAGKSGDEHEF